MYFISLDVVRIARDPRARQNALLVLDCTAIWTVFHSTNVGSAFVSVFGRVSLGNRFVV